MTPDEISESVKWLREHYSAAGMHTLPEIRTINALVELVAEMKWREIETAPETGEPYLGAIAQPDGGFGEPFMCYWDIDEHHRCVHQTETIAHKPTHWFDLKLLAKAKTIAKLGSIRIVGD